MESLRVEQAAYDALMVTYRADLALYQPYADGIISARTRFATKFWRDTTPTSADAWEVLFLSKDSPALPSNPTPPSRTTLDNLTAAREVAEISLWNQWMDSYGCLDEF